jgi:hypothetical protein
MVQISFFAAKRKSKYHQELNTQYIADQLIILLEIYI